MQYLMLGFCWKMQMQGVLMCLNRLKTNRQGVRFQLADIPCTLVFMGEADVGLTILRYDELAMDDV